jgi:hypothetical protein
MAAYEDKLNSVERFKQTEVQDLYDIYYLISLINRVDATSVKRLKALIGKIDGNPPPNMGSLGHLIIAGLPPTFDLMVNTIKKWLSDNSKGHN